MKVKALRARAIVCGSQLVAGLPRIAEMGSSLRGRAALPRNLRVTGLHFLTNGSRLPASRSPPSS